MAADKYPIKRIVLWGVIWMILLTVALILLLGPRDLNKNKDLRLDAVKLWVTGVLAYGGAVTLWLALNRQRHHESDTTVLREAEAQKQYEARYDAAVTQFAAENSAVRIAGLYGFDRLGNQANEYRQPIMLFLCSALQVTPLTLGQGDSEERRDIIRKEGEVRRAIERVIERHLTPDNASHWPGMIVDLSNARLEEFNVPGATFEAGSSFEDCRISHSAEFSNTHFLGDVRFGKAEFPDATTFRNAVFDKGVSGYMAKFRTVDFTNAIFKGGVTLEECNFGFKPQRYGSKPQGEVLFDGATFHAGASFYKSKIFRCFSFQGAKVGDIYFDNAGVSGGYSFKGATITGRLSFGSFSIKNLKPDIFKDAHYLPGALIHEYGMTDAVHPVEFQKLMGQPSPHETS